ncbi:hypothetical protein ACFLZX_01610 [Nanoarchaeota archaeon]
MKKSQMQLGETIAILLVFMLLVGLGFAFYARVNSISVQRQLIQLEEQRAIHKVQTITNLPELICSSREVVTDYCVDLYKVYAALGPDGVFQKEVPYYRRLYGNSYVKLHWLSGIDTPIDFLLFNSTVGGSANVFHFPVLINDPVNNTNHFGMIEVGVSIR